MSLRRGETEEEAVPGSDLTGLAGLMAREGGGELLWGGDTGGLAPAPSSGDGWDILAWPAPRALKAEARPEVREAGCEAVGELYGENRFCLSLSEIMLAWLL